MLSGLSRGWPLVGYPLRAVLDWDRHHPSSFRLDGICDPANATLLFLNDYDHWQSQAGGTWDPHEISYGLSDFGKLIQEGYWYQDRTDELRGFTEPRSKRS